MDDSVDLLCVEGASQSFRTGDGEQLLALDDVSVRLREREILAVLGKSGSGKSTLLRLMAGLSLPSKGCVRYRGNLVDGPVRGVAMVFQSFALFPWLTVLQNVELGLEAMGLPRQQRRQRALAAINVIGLDGFESAFPKELSGGMRQRVGFARALVINPEILLMDEPFSALDVLTAETLRTDLLELWGERRISTKGIVFVSHNIEEAVLMADRILIISGSPGGIRAEVAVPFKRPRDRQTSAFRHLVEEIYTIMTSVPQLAARADMKRERVGLGYRLPDVSTNQLEGLMEAVLAAPYQGRADLPDLAQNMQFAVDELFPLLDVLDLLGFAHVGQGDIVLTAAGRDYVHADTDGRKRLFAEHLLHHIPLAAHIRRVLDERRGHRAPKERFQGELEDYLTDEEAERVLRVAINWGRYAELYAYDDNAGVLSLENGSS